MTHIGKINIHRINALISLAVFLLAEYEVFFLYLQTAYIALSLVMLSLLSAGIIRLISSKNSAHSSLYKILVWTPFILAILLLGSFLTSTFYNLFIGFEGYEEGINALLFCIFSSVMFAVLPILILLKKPHATS